tara:strand:+ start:1211 stop:1672 length:462 start_codon:yes stop_codon:yes gene_type:complete
MIKGFNKWLLESASYISSIKDEDIIAATIVGEAGGEDYEGLLAIKNVLDNRAKNKNTSAAGEAIRPKQFSMWNSATKSVSTKADFDDSALKSIIDKHKNHEKWDDAMAIAIKQIKDTTKGATDYYAHNKIDPPYWTKNWKETVVIGNHTFGIV